MKSVRIKDGIFWVGGVDWKLRNFHGYLTQRGSSYNAYLVIDKKVTLIDTVKNHLFDDMIERIKDVINPENIDYIVVNHVEMDHSGSVPDIVSVARKAKIVSNSRGINGIKKHYGENFNFQEVKTGDVLDIGERKIKFIETPMIHWPDNMVEFVDGEGLLFSNDSFGQHIASTERFDDEFSFDIVLEEAKKYYANIVLPYSSQVQKILDLLSNFKVEMILPSHGLIWRKGVRRILDEYSYWAKNSYQKKCVIVFDSMWGSTEKMAYKIFEAFEESCYTVRVFDLKLTHISDIMTEVLDSEFVCIGSPTLNRNIMPTVSAFLSYLKGLSPKNRKLIVFGSYGWVGKSVDIIEDDLKSFGFDIVFDNKIQFVPTYKDLEMLKEECIKLLK